MNPCAEVMTTIKLSGPLIRLFGREHQRVISTPREVFRALSVTLPGFEKYMNTSKARGQTFARGAETDRRAVCHRVGDQR